jgi:hypothetical protein
LDVLIVHHCGQTVAAQQEPVACGDLYGGLVDLEVVFDAERSSKNAPLRVDPGLLRREPPLSDHALDERVVLGECPKLAVAEEVRSRVAHMSQMKPVAADNHRRERRSHPRESRFLGGALAHGPIGLMDRLSEPLRDCVFGAIGRRCLRQPLKRDLRGYFAADVTAEPVGHGEERILGNERIFVPLPEKPHIRFGPRPEFHLRTSRTVFPIRMLSPGASVAGTDTFRWFRYVPLVEPRSSITHDPLRFEILACC